MGRWGQQFLRLRSARGNRFCLIILLNYKCKWNIRGVRGTIENEIEVDGG